MIHIIPDTILRAVCWTLLHSLWQGLIVAVFAGVIMVLTKKSSSSLRYNLLCILLFLFLGVSGYTFYRQLPAGGLPAAGLPAAATVIRGGAAVATPSQHMVAPVAGVAVQSGIDNLIQYCNTHAALIVLVWFIIFLGRFVKMLSGLVYAQRIRHYQTSDAPTAWQERLQELLNKMRIVRPVRLLESALIKVPVTLGFFKPAILVPIGMLVHISPDQVESILLHELAHIRRGDYLLNFIQNVVDTLFFFNPAMIWISSLIRAERENCCDDVAIRETRSRRRLIEALVSFHEYEQAAGGCALSFAAKENQVVRRVKRIVHKKNHSLNAGERVLLTAGLLVLSAAFVTINNSRADVAGRGLKASVKPAHVTTTMGAAATTVKSAPGQRLGQPAAKPLHPPVGVRGQTPVEVQRQAPVGVRGQTQVDVQAGVPVEGPEKLPSQAPVEVQNLAPVGDTTPKTQKTADLFRNAGVDKLIEARDHGVTAEFVSALEQMGYKDLSLDKAIELRDHGVDAAFIEDIRALGLRHLSLDDAIRLRDHGVSADYVAGMKKRFGKLFEINDYIKLRDAGISPTTFGQ